MHLSRNGRQQWPNKNTNNNNNNNSSSNNNAYMPRIPGQGRGHSNEISRLNIIYN